MASPDTQYLPGSRRFTPSPGRILLIAAAVCALWGSGLAVGGWAAKVALEAARASRDIPWAPWLLAFALIVSGMLSTVYGVFFRPRALEVSAEEVAFIQWDGKGRGMRRSEVRAVESAPSRVTLRGESRTLVIPRMFNDWQDITGELAAWDRA